MDKNQIQQDLQDIQLKFNEPLSKYTYTKTGGPADVLLFPKSQEEVCQIVAYCSANHYPWMVLGNASNLIVRDGGIEGFVLMLTEMKNIQIEGTRLIVDGGASLIETTKQALEASLTGMEFASGIPGSIGGAVYMNAGAYGGEITDVFESCTVVWEDGKVETIPHDQMAFSYRHSCLQERKGAVLSVSFALKPGNREQIQARMDELTHLRESKQPLEFPSCGSVFKRPEGYYTGKLIQEAGLQGFMIGGAQVSTKHAGFIVNTNNATATDYVELIRHIQKVIFEKNNVKLETEVRIIGRE
ncbi:UDP-N-acetylmuramate dehydrogenase [Vagococcus elongatus]|uniref:UDP-N-acetylenolpyruvoylglucosamine reductase n=1 Tax=Vagococcus elongatus TaxID=180344 RepID=A0A430B4K9_9ENTE|nr:UDP-N-acetylmuramate dehydrogenase [Vagococcus elongatus]RSU15254.1 UDP-N-acetylenolpyruvoylglucosamine reductase [Vagococcus elongatus]